MGQEYSTTSTRDRQKKSLHRTHISHNKDPDPTRIIESHRSPHSSKCSSSSNSYATAISRTNSTASSSLSSSHYHLPIYTNVHYRDVNNNDIYKPLKINKNNIHKLKILNADKDTAIYLEKHLSIKSYLNPDEVKKKSSAPQPPPPSTQKKAGIRNYTPKILSEKDPQKDLEHWI